MLDILIGLAKYGSVYLPLYVVSLMAYRLWFHPLRHIPGPALSRITYLYEWYYDLYLGGQFTFKLKDLHETYGRTLQCLLK